MPCSLKPEVIVLDEEVIMIEDDEDEEDCILIGSYQHLGKNVRGLPKFSPVINSPSPNGFDGYDLPASQHSYRSSSSSDKSSSRSSSSQSSQSFHEKYSCSLASQSYRQFSASPKSAFPVTTLKRPPSKKLRNGKDKRLQRKALGVQQLNPFSTTTFPSEALSQASKIIGSFDAVATPVIPIWKKPVYPIQSIAKAPVRNSLIALPLQSQEVVSFGPNGQKLMVGDFIETLDGDFIQIKNIICNIDNHSATVRGYRLQRCNAMNGILEKKLNEICFFYEYESDDPRQALEQCVEDVALSEIKGKRNVRLSNQKFPHDRNMVIANHQDHHDAAQQGGLTVRWKFTAKYSSFGDRNTNQWYEKVLEHIRENEVTRSPERLTITDASRRFEWRGETIFGGAFLPQGSRTTKTYSNLNQGTEVIFQQTIGRSDRDNVAAMRPDNQNIWLSPKHQESPTLFFSTNHRSQLASSRTRSSGQMLTYGDAFCGAGGATRGASMAGLKVLWGFDHCPHACASWRKNFPNSKLYQEHSSVFVQKAQERERAGSPNIFKVDILHLSPPCQYFSVAHSVMGPADEANIASLYAVRDVIEIAKPRVVTLEQTFGLSFERHSPYLNSLIHMFSSLDFSLRWAVQEMAQWGLPQRRRRLLIIAACPGEILPEFPAATHSPDGENGLQPFVTVNSVLQQIPRDAPNHDISNMKEKDEVPWDGNSILPRSMTTHGGQNHHPSGRRDFTPREYASLQGFPINHAFLAPYVRKQIGNAVPPCVAKVLFESIKRQLDVADGIADVREEREEREQREVITID